MEFAKSDTVYVPLGEEIVQRIQVTTEIVGDIAEDTLATKYVDKLNDDLDQARLTGESVKLVSDSLMWMDESIDGTETINQAAITPEQRDASEAVGIFMGVSEMLIDQQRTLMYRLNMGFDDETMTARSVLAPVDESTLLVGTTGSVEAAMTEAFENHIRKLRTIDNPDFQEVFADLLDTIQECDGIDGSYIRGIGLHVTWLMAQDGVHDDDEMRHALNGIIALSIRANVPYYIVGQKVTFNAQGAHGDTVITPHNSIDNIQVVSTVTDYDTDSHGELVYESTMQPAFIVTDSQGIQHFIPLKHIRNFSEASHDTRCQSSMQRFLKMYPDVLKTVD